MQSDSTLEETPEGNLTVEENSQTPNVLIAQSGTVIPETEKAKYIDFLKRNEKVMPKKYKDQKGKPTIAVGHLITPQENKTGIIYDIPFRKGLDSQQIDTILNKDLMAKEQSVAAYLKENHGVDFASLTPVKQVMLLDMHFNPGLNKFPKFVGAILNGDYETQGKEYKRFLTKGKKTYPLVLRNQTFHNEYVRHSMAEDIVKKRIGQGNLTFIPDLESIQERTNQIMSKYQVGGVIIPTYPATFPSG
jgi:GH24 family phage-related lysozyme (muramidase)